MTRGLKRDEQEQVFYRRLIYDGYGTGEDKRLVNIIKNITQLYLDSSDKLNIKLAGTILKDIEIAMQSAENRVAKMAYSERKIARVEEAIQSKKGEIDLLRGSLGDLALEKQYAHRVRQVVSLRDTQSSREAIATLEERKQRLQLKVSAAIKLKEELAEQLLNLAKLISEKDCDDSSSEKKT